jgi:uncharacterized membrane protein YgaE (UPF0421/DUF939 family)
MMNHKIFEQSAFPHIAHLRTSALHLTKNLCINLSRKEIKEPKMGEYQEHRLPYNTTQERSLNQKYLLKRNSRAVKNMNTILTILDKQ